MSIIRRATLLLMCFLFLGAWPALAAWKATSISKGGYYNSIAIDPSGRPHISYLDDSNPVDYVLRHAYLDGKSWRTELVDSGDVGWDNAIAADSLGHLHISYRADYPWSLRYAYFDGTTWSVTPVDSGGYSTSIAIDDDNLPHISYVDSAYNLKYARFDGNQWIVDTISGSGVFDFGGTSIALGKSGEAHITFSDSSLPRRLYWATNASGSWVVSHIGEGRQSSLALDSASHPHVVYNSESTREIIYTKHDGLSWSSESLTAGSPEPGVGESPAIALDSEDLPHVSLGFYAWNYDVELTIYGRKTDAGWESVLVDSKNAGFNTSIALDQWDLPHLSYRRAVNDEASELKYANSGIYPPEITSRRLKDGRIGKKYNAKLKAKKGGKTLYLAD